ncbi:MAG: DUF22 domain-containing protein [ANME-2 cluster archaeon]|nr:DUF22 domain-containing protein [ANME-2 cluster archaeon]MDF1532089.1 DUF22 domain-containing protein [ANME-2 cluster archaeon]
MAEIVNIVSKKDSEILSMKIQASPYEFTMATRAKWEMVVADENMTIGKGKFEKIKIKKIHMQKDTLALPCAFNHHALVSVVKIGGKGGCSAPVEFDRTVDSAYVLGIDSGEVRKGDLLAVINVFPIMFTRDASVPVKVK